jgi:enediyne biosynthesis protein E4
MQSSESAPAGSVQNESMFGPSFMGKAVLIVALALVALVGIGVAIYRSAQVDQKSGSSPPSSPDVPKRDVQQVPRLVFSDITEEAGIRFHHTNGAAGKKLLPETMGSGVAFIDYDKDGHQDLLFVNSRPWPGSTPGKMPTMALYRNRGDGTFEDVTVKMGLDVPLYGQGVCVGDYDNDGWPDIFITAIGGNRLFHNEHGTRFRDVTEAVGLPGSTWPKDSDDFLKQEKPIAWPSSATFLDYDGDGKLDLFVCQYVTWSPAIDLGIDFKLVGLGRAYGRPTNFEGSQCILYRNNGDKFEDVTVQAGIQVLEDEGVAVDARKRNVAKSLGVIVCDPDEDGWPDIVVANDTVRNFFFHNVKSPDGKRHYEEIGLKVGLAYAEANARGGMGIDWGEVLAGSNAIVIANFANEPCSFLCQDRPGRLAFADQSIVFGLAGPSLGPLKFGTFFADVDLDGRLDLLSNNGHLEPEIAKVQAGQSFAQSPQMFWNTGRRIGCFEPFTEKQAGQDLFKPLVGRGSAYADIDGDGDTDFVLTANNGPARLLRNDNTLGHHWVRLVLEGDGKRSNKSAIGATVTLEADNRVQTRYIAGARGYLSQSELPVTFGLGKVNKIDRVTIRWPGKDAGPPTELSDLAVDKAHSIVQPPVQK